MTSVVVDASVAVKWLPLFSSEALSTQATALLDRRNRDDISLLVPDLFWPEVGSVLWKAFRRHACTSAEAQSALLSLQDQFLATVPTIGLMQDAMHIALQYGRSIYDSVYVALAVSCDGELVTADEKLANAVAAHLPVTWLGAI